MWRSDDEKTGRDWADTALAEETRADRAEAALREIRALCDDFHVSTASVVVRAREIVNKTLSDGKDLTDGAS